MFHQPNSSQIFGKHLDTGEILISHFFSHGNVLEDYFSRHNSIKFDISYLTGNNHNFVTHKIFSDIPITTVIEEAECGVQSLSHNSGLVLIVPNNFVPNISALSDSMGVELHQHEEMHQHLPYHALILRQLLAGLGGGLAKGSRQLQSLDVADSTDQEGPKSPLLDSVLMRDKIEQTVLD